MNTPSSCSPASRLCHRVPLCLLALLLQGQGAFSLRADSGTGWFVGAAKVDITPDYPVRLGGVGSRRTESEGVAQHIFAKAIAISDGTDEPALLITVDNVGVPRAIRDELVKRLAAKTKVVDERVALCSSHTHSAPMLVGFSPDLFSTDIPPDHWAHMERYTRELTDHLEKVALAALASRRPAQMAWGVGYVGFARNRRNRAFRPEDHALPVLRITGADGKVSALLTSYACHCTTLTVPFNRIAGDWAGCAQEYMEKEFPGAIALTAIGCAGDQNPDPRGTPAYAGEYGNALGAEAERLATGRRLKPVTGRLECRLTQISLPFQKLPTRAEWEAREKDRSPIVAYHARAQLAKLDRGEKLPTALPYLVQVWNFGSDLAIVFLDGEVVVDYSLRLKREFDSERLWVNAYSNDVPCYIPSERVLQEGGYEGAGAMLYYDRPAPFAPGLEDLIVNTVHQLMPKEFERGHGVPGRT